MRKRFAEIREKSGKSQQKMAAEIGVSISTLCAFESGRKSEFFPTTRMKLAKGYQVPVSEINDACDEHEDAGVPVTA